jgi:hypothetical protein
MAGQPPVPLSERADHVTMRGRRPNAAATADGRLQVNLPSRLTCARPIDRTQQLCARAPMPLCTERSSSAPAPRCRCVQPLCSRLPLCETALFRMPLCPCRRCAELVNVNVRFRMLLCANGLPVRPAAVFTGSHVCSRPSLSRSGTCSPTWQRASSVCTWGQAAWRYRAPSLLSRHAPELT